MTTLKPTPARIGRPPKVTEESIGLAMELLCRCYHKHQIKEALARKWGMSACTAERVLQRAREELRQRMGLSREEHQGNSLALYEALIRDAKVSAQIKLFARARIDKLLGLESQFGEHSAGEDETVSIRQAVVQVAIPPGAIPSMAPSSPVQDDSRGTQGIQDGTGQAIPGPVPPRLCDNAPDVG